MRRLLDAAPVLAALAFCAGLLLYGSGRGFDLTDEVFYLIWARDPQAYQLTYQPFGHILHPLFRAVGFDLQAYRLAGFAIAALAGAFLGQTLAPAPGQRPRFSLYGALAALTLFFPWIVTPSYNACANVGALLILGGVFAALRPTQLGRVAAVLAGGTGLALAAYGKPPLFAIAVVVMLLTAVVSRNARVAMLSALLLGAVLIFGILAPAELVALVGRISTSQHVLALPNTPLALPAKVVRDALAAPWTLIGAAGAAALGLALPRSRATSWLSSAAIALSLAYVPQAAQDLIDGDMPDFIGLALTTATAGYAAMIRPRRPHVLLLLAAPAAVALGTFNNQWFQLNFSLAFPFLALFALAAADPAPWRRGGAQTLAVLGPVAVLLLAALRPYSLPAPIFDQQVPIDVPLAKGPVRVDPETAAFVRGARGLAGGDLLIDLSGTGPGVAQVLGARAPVLPWLNPATPTWPDVVWARLTPQERERASFVLPAWPGFERSAPAQWFAAHRGAYCRTPLPPMTFWGEERRLELWRRCA